MPRKGEKKTVPKKKEKSDSNGPVFQKKCLKPNPEDNISKSKKLTEKLKNIKPTTKRSGRPKTCPDESRICGNGKPMPSLADLEKMFEDSDDDEEHKIGTPKKSKPSEILPQVTPEKPVIITEEKLTSPGTIKKIADKMLDLISNLPDPILIDDGPPRPIIPPKKRKKPEVPYIVGCKERPQVPQKPSVNFCKGDDYGIEKNQGIDDDECPKKRAKRTKPVNLSKSIFNAKSDEIAAWLKDIDKAEHSDGSSDSNKTVEYELVGGPRSFSPLPSTSKDNETISQNDKRFIDSLVSETVSDDSTHSVCVIEDKTNTTIVIDDDEVIIDEQNRNKINTNDCIEVIELNDVKDNIKTNEKCENSEIIIDEEYEDCYKFVYTEVPNAGVSEIIDVDAVIAENQAIIEKISKVEKLNSVTHVDSSCISALNNTASVNKSELNSTENLGINSNASNHEELALNSPANQIKRIVKSFFQNNSKANEVYSNDRSNSEANMLKSKYENTHCDLFTNFATWINSIQSVQSKSTVQNTEVSNTHAVNDEVIEIDDNYFPTMNISNHTSSRNRRRNRLLNTLHNPSSSRNSAQKSCCPWNSNHPSRVGNRIENQFILEPQLVMSNWITQNRTAVQNGLPDHYNTVVIQSPVQPAPVQPPPAQLPPVQPSPVQNSSPIRKGIGDCPICMDNLANNSVASTTCGHVFCMECIKAAVKANGKRCPTCRKVLKGVGFHQLFL